MDIELYKGEKSFTAQLEVDAETGEVIGGGHLELLVKRNPIGSIAFILSENKKKEIIDLRIKELQAISKVITRNAERARESLKYVMQVSGTKKVESSDKTFKAVLHVERDESVEIFDDKQIPSEYMREIPAKYLPDKDLIKKAIKDGYEVTGAKLLIKDRLTLG
jgi:hypothetical protein